MADWTSAAVMDKLYQVTAPHFCAGMVERGGFIVEAAPILRWAVGEPIVKLGLYCQRKGWRMVLVQSYCEKKRSVTPR